MAGFHGRVGAAAEHSHDLVAIQGYLSELHRNRLGTSTVGKGGHTVMQHLIMADVIERIFFGSNPRVRKVPVGEHTHAHTRTHTTSIHP